MFLYLAQHAEAKREEDDLSRPLSEKGFEDIKRVASHLGGSSIRVDRILHSPKLRARQTAQILAEHLKPAEGLREVEGLAPMDAPLIWAERLENMSGSLLLVGHLPHMERLASLLLCGDPDKKVVTFTMGGVVSLMRADGGRWSLRWLITPQIAQSQDIRRV